nr:suppressor of gene silencing like protein [Ipomoea batatas]GME20446.1 suppressor of gene silencing like protein [Ipomoea batatas]
MAGGNPQNPPSSSTATSRRKSRRKSSAKNRRFSNSRPSQFGSRSGENKPRPSTKHTGAPTTPPTHMLRPVNSSPRPDEATHSAMPSLRFLDQPQPPPPPPANANGVHLLERRTLVLADGSARTYFALPPDYHDFSPLPPREFRGPGLGFDRNFPVSPDLRPEFRDDPFLHTRNHDYQGSLGLEQGDGPVTGPGPGHENSMKRKFWDDETEANDYIDRKRQQLLQLGNLGDNSQGMNELHTGRGSEEMKIAEVNTQPLKHHEVDQKALKKAFLRFAKSVYEVAKQKNRYLANGKQGHLQCEVCGRESKRFRDMHSLIMHAYHSDNADSTVDHLGFHKALCVLMGWNYLTAPDSSKSYQLLSAGEAAANLDDLIIWPPLVIIHNTITGKHVDGRVEGYGNKFMDDYLRDIGCKGGKSKASFNKGGYLGITLVKFAGDQSGLKEAMRLAEYFQRGNHGRGNWALVQRVTLYKDEENNPDLVKVDPQTGEKKRIFYGYLANISDLDKIEADTKKRVSVESQTELLLSQ